MGRLRWLGALTASIVVAAGVAAAPALAAPANDDRSAATPIASTLPSHNPGSTVGATLESGEAAPCGMTDSVWWSYTPATAMRLQADLIHSESDHSFAIAVWTAGGDYLGCNGSIYTSGFGGMALDVDAGVTYLFQVGTHWSSWQGAVELTVRDASDPPVLSGRITDTDGNPLSGICVRVVMAENASISVATGATLADGTWAAEVPQGLWKAEFNTCFASGSEYERFFWDERGTFAEADVIDARAGDVGDIDAALLRFPPPPGPPAEDVAISALQVDTGPPNALGGADPGQPWMVTVRVANLGDERVGVLLDAGLCPVGPGECQLMENNRGVALDPAQEHQFDFVWTPRDYYGDVEIRAFVELSPTAVDPNPANNAAAVRAHAVFDGHGFGTRTSPPPRVPNPVAGTVPSA